MMTEVCLLFQLHLLLWNLIFLSEMKNVKPWCQQKVLTGEEALVTSVQESAICTTMLNPLLPTAKGHHDHFTAQMSVSV